MQFPVFCSVPQRLTSGSAWHEHIPFAMYLVDILRPDVIMELGTYRGDSYCAFCQAVRELKLSTRTYAVDTWEGDPQTGFYGPDLLADLKAYHDPLYGSFSTLIQSSFDEAIRYFPDGTVTLLHIDGYHTYETVEREVRSWLPKMGPRGVILLHDINVREREFGVWRLWKELTKRHPHFEFTHGHGLGVLGVGESFPQGLQELFDASDEKIAEIREVFFRLGRRVAEEARARSLSQVVEERTQKVKALDDELGLKRMELSQLQAQYDAEVAGLKAEIERLAAEHHQTASALAQLRAEKERLAAEHRQSAGTLARRTEELAQLKAEKERLAADQKQDVQELQKKDAVLNQIYGSHGWKALSVYYGLREKLLPQGSRRRKVAKFFWTIPHGRFFRLSEGILLLRDMRLIAASGLFDGNWYLQQNPDVAKASVNPLRHYLRGGAREGRDPNPLFDTSWYLQQNPDVAKAGVNPLAHYLRHGAREGRDPNPLFDATSYLRQNPDVAMAGVNPLAHYLRGGASVGRVENAVSVLRDLVETPKTSKNPIEVQGIQVIDPHPITCSVSPVQSRRGAGGRRLICVSHVLPYPSRAGNEYRIQRMLAWLVGQGFEIFPVICPLPGSIIPTDQFMDACSVYPNLILCHRNGTLFHHLAGGDALLDDLAGVKPRAFGKLLREEEHGPPAAQKLLPIVRTFCPDMLVEVLLHLDMVLRPEVFWVNYVFMTRFLPLIHPQAVNVVDTIDVFSTKCDKVVQFGIEDSLALTAEQEAGLLAQADLVIAIQPDEAEELRRIVPHKPIVTAGVDFNPIDPMPGPARDPVILFVGSDNHLNVRGLQDFLRFAWPLIRRQVPQAELRVAGAVGTRVDVDDPAVKIMGRIENLAAAYAEARVVINPSVAGTGLKIKTIEALCHLRPLVTWPSGLEGLGTDVSMFCHVARDWYGFARHVIRLCAEEGAPDALISKRDEIRQSFSADTVYKALGTALVTACAKSE